MSLPTNPAPLGQLKPGADFATKVVRAIAALVTAGAIEDTAPGRRVKDLVIQAASANTGSIFITNDGKVPAADYSNVLRELVAGAFYSAGSAPSPNIVDSGLYYVSAQNADDFAFGEVREG